MKAEPFDEKVPESCEPTATLTSQAESRPPADDEAPPRLPDYELLKRIGRGGQGQVWLARNALDEQFYAVKVFPRGAFAEIAGLREYKRRVREHPHLVPIEHVGEAGDLRYSVMPLADPAHSTSPVLDPAQYEPMSLARHVERLGRLALSEVCSIGQQMLEAIGYLHAQGARHGDVKPRNILKLQGRWQLADHGLVANAECRKALGFTPAYCPPEGPDDRVADLYALGVTLFEVASGLEPERIGELVAGSLGLPGDDPRRRALERLLRRACDPDPSRRFRNARDMTAALREVRGAAARSRRRRPALAAAAIVLVGGGLVLTAALGGRRGAGPQPIDGAPLEVRSMRVSHLRGDKALGLIGSGSTAAAEEDEAEVHVELSQPGYCFILALNPDGTVQRCSPRDDAAPPERAMAFDAPLLEDGTPGAFAFTDGPGAQAFVVIAARDPLPAYRDWLKQVGPVPWRAFDLDRVWEYDGSRFDSPEADRGKIRRAVATPEPFAGAVEALRGAPGVEGVRAIVFQVRRGAPEG